MAGMPRAGTTFVYDALLSHPSIFLPFRKELGFFSLHHDRGVGWYNTFFSGATAHQVTGDISPDYFLHPAAIKRVRDFQRPTKLIIAVRDPAEWAVSFHRYMCTFGKNEISFEEFLQAHEVPDTRWLNSSRTRTLFSIKSALVRTQIEAFRQTFGSDLLLYHFSHFRSMPLTVLQAIEEFLGVPSYFNSVNIPTAAINTSSKRGPNWLNYLTSRDEFVTMAGNVFPRRWLQRIRFLSDTAASHGRAFRPDSRYKDDISLGKEILREDEKYVANLFECSPFLRGDEKLFRT